MRLDEFESSQPEVGDILEIEIGNELVETVIVSINRGNYIVESTNTDLLESKLNEVNPHNYDSDLDYYDAVRRSGRRRSSDDYEPADSGPTDDDIHYAKQRAQQQAQAKTAPVQKQSDNDGQAPNGERYNTVVTFTSADNNRNKMAADSYKDYHWGAKKVVDSKEDNGVYTLYVVDNHKHGMWKPWKDQPAEGVAEEFNGEYDDEAGMAQSNLRTMARAVDGLIDTIKDNDNLPEWAQEKLAKAEMMTTGVWDYLLSQKEQGVDPKVTENYPKHQDLSGISTDKLKAYLAKQSQQQVSGEGNQVQRVRAELERRQQGVAEVSDELRNRYVSRASSDYGSANFAARASKSHPGLEDYSKEQEARAKKRAAGLNRALSDKRRGVSESVNKRAEKKEKVKVYVKNPKTGRVVKVDFGEPGQLIKKSKKHRKHGKKRWNLKK